MKIFAGLKLNGRKPMQAPASAAMMSAVTASPSCARMMKMETEEMVQTPQARPSRPSIQFTAFMRATTQSRVRGIENIPSLIYSPFVMERKSLICDILRPNVIGISAATA